MPNPFRHLLTVEFDLPVGGATLLRVYDVAGRLVRTLHRGPLPAGTTALVWDGRDHDGNRVTSGVYRFVVRASGVEQVVNGTLVR